ncbi:peptidylprolyl isomerase [Burkholderia vietnamiensis]|uniref:Periplasmic chaperone PpiD n=1 Tax=Burkholderia vietnamiensis (strain G4 / LMG 22486) TaxID=269482 RepID=A4JF02_BURVG|nr:SurA N-terminal domain-containing protein [Burkholderia vietnamiensis]ABO54855.1 PpiC-type peptidyl-prolyl cis-trans isomerase [Burkholderia vietnamiensis G4]KVG07021.1 peptidylprolyl isomerase [Burkholderia vietnamiensis]KVR92112.1 peptidylprolyl isomerase [Burkholderia vietnamiensis]MBR8192195.1 SurA N-terminal domain-containing protein [Burkholderia vietnamiensis]MCA8068558.1 SurA N-terminal domain-containing protein [Burkholderia vietnamiensis]
MLDFFRNHQRLMMALLLLIVLPGLGFVGIQGFRGFFDDSANVAAVNGHKITRVEFDGAFRQQIDQARQALGGQFDIKMFDTPEHRKQVLDGLIQQRVLADETQRLHLTASDNAVRDALMSDPMIASLKKPDGTIDVQRYAQLLSFQGMTPEQYQERVRYSLALQQIPASIVSSAFTPKGPAQRLSELAAQQREVQALVLKSSDFAAKVQPTDAQLTAYYDAHKQSFATPETATIQYLVYSPAAAAAAASAQPTDADIKKFYDDNPTHFRSEAQVRISHIFIAAASNASAADKAAAKAKAEQLLADVKAHPDQFAQIAQKSSQDAPSAAKGGDLGFITRGSTAGGKAFDDAAFALKQGEVSGVVESDLGFHILKATEVKPSVVKPFADVKDQIAVDLKQQYAAKAFTDNAEGFTSTVYEKAKSLQPAADKYKLTIQTATVTPTPNPQLPPTSPLNNPKFLAAVFASDSVKSRNNTQAVDVGNNTLISAHVVDYKPAAVPALDAIKDVVRQKVVAEQAAELAKKDGAAKLAELQKSKSTDGFTPAQKVSRTQSQGLTPAALSAVYKVDSKTLPAYVGVDLGADGYAIYRVNAVIPGTAVDPQQLAAAQQQMAQVEAQSEGEAYLAALRDRSKVKLYGTTQSPSQDSGN